MRITSWHQYNTFLNDLNSITGRLAKTQEKLSTQREISTASDDPVKAAQILSYDAQLADVETWRSNISNALGLLDSTDSALNNVTSTLTSVRTKLINAGSTNDVNARNAIANELLQLKQSVLDGANARFGDKFLFSGTATSTQPYPNDAYAGDAGLINRRVAPNLQVPLNVPGDQVFGTTTGAAYNQMNVMDVIDQLAADIQAGGAALDSALSAGLDALDAHMANISQQRAFIGTTTNRLEQQESILGDMESRLLDARSQIADADMAKTMIEFQAQQTMYESALAAGGRIMKTSILDFI
jgi:flagellar hook-associated protein 3 FlgL